MHTGNTRPSRLCVIQEYQFLEMHITGIQKYKLQKYQNVNYRNKNYRNTERKKISQIQVQDINKYKFNSKLHKYKWQKYKLEKGRNTNYKIKAIQVKQKFCSSIFFGWGKKNNSLEVQLLFFFAGEFFLYFIEGYINFFVGV